ncbi:MAG: acyl-CoA thioesterase [Bdellovibrionaceae bacterium]|nr:acyl-CoA thioesterase [Pseudobdellovibrionaceae bacterium]
MEKVIHTYHFDILYQHLDTFGHVNNAAYLQLFEEARWNLIESNGYGLKKIQDSKKGPTILDINIRFKKELHFKEKCYIETLVPESNRKIMKMKQNLYDSKKELACTAQYTFAFFDLVKRKIIAPSTDWLRAVHIE